MDERDLKEQSLEAAAAGAEEVRPAAVRRRDALFRMAKLAAIPVAVAGLSQACGATYSRYTAYCNGACRNYTHYGDSYCNYSDYTDTACYVAYCNACCRNYSVYGSTYCNYSNYVDWCCH